MRRGSGLLISLCATVLAGCASSSATSREKNPDPFEAINRPIYEFNETTDRFILRPLGKGYNYLLPQFVRTGIGNFFDNASYLRTIINDFLQGKFKQGFADTGRLALNTTVGLLGFVDVASDAGLPFHYEDFGQTFSVWGIPEGPYLVIPLIGPRTLSHAVGTYADLQVNPIVQMNNSSVRDKLLILGVIETRAALIGPDEIVQDAYDPYLFVRQAYFQNRQFLINDGKQPGPSDGFDEEFFEDEFGDESDDDIDADTKKESGGDF